MLAQKVTPESLEGIYKKAHAAIRKEPTKTLPKKEKKAGGARKAYNTKKLTKAARKEAVKKKIETLRKRLVK